MIKIRNLDLCEVTNKGYGGHSGSKRSILIDGEYWFLKYPKSTKSMDVKGLSYTTTPLSEYLGSHIYESVGIDTHKTILGISNGKIVVACKDFLKNTEEIIDFNAIRNNYDEKTERYLEERHSSAFDRNDDLEDVMYIMDNNDYFEKVPKLKERFWDMFIIDSFISNNDRNEANWGLIYNKETRDLSLSPVYDNGASFYGKSSDEKLQNILKDNFKFKQMVYDSSVSTFMIDEHLINPLKYIESMDNDDCNKALIRIVPKIDMNKIKNIFDEIPNEYNGLSIFSDVQKEIYYKTLKYKLEKVFIPTYDKLIKKDYNEGNDLEI